MTTDAPAPGRRIGRTPRERARRIRLWALVALGAAVVTTVLARAVPETAAVGVVAGPVLLATAIVTGAVALNLTSRAPELLWMVCGLLVFWAANSAIYLHLAAEANTTLATVPEQGVIDLLSALFTAGVVAVVAAALIAVLGWLLRPGRWNALNGPDGQS